ncbi:MULTISPECIES: hypothetical protein [Hymenobacter]|uniref:Uncharacterized protein n=1 Tax=Hymenobacter profundi TaxID=1982110 RepID=A0ABS6X2K6_9BACT|nr:MULTISPECIES: hypothetical protein [Hymenobacter]MBW3129919.1 hypothetical protein [Hymenobacter profundi]
MDTRYFARMREEMTKTEQETTNWRAWYWLVLGALAVEIGFFAYLTNLFA